MHSSLHFILIMITGKSYNKTSEFYKMVDKSYMKNLPHHSLLENLDSKDRCIAKLFQKRRKYLNVRIKELLSAQTSLVVQLLRLHAANAGLLGVQSLVRGLIPLQQLIVCMLQLKIPCATAKT